MLLLNELCFVERRVCDVRNQCDKIVVRVRDYKQVLRSQIKLKETNCPNFSAEVFFPIYVLPKE